MYSIYNYLLVVFKRSIYLQLYPAIDGTELADDKSIIYHKNKVRKSLYCNFSCIVKFKR